MYRKKALEMPCRPGPRSMRSGCRAPARILGTGRRPYDVLDDGFHLPIAVMPAFQGAAIQEHVKGFRLARKRDEEAVAQTLPVHAHDGLPLLLARRRSLLAGVVASSAVARPADFLRRFG
jgi:hypothetical protein